MVIELRVVQFWSEIILVIPNRTCAARSFDFEILRMISDQIALHSVQLPLQSISKQFMFNDVSVVGMEYFPINTTLKKTWLSHRMYNK